MRVLRNRNSRFSRGNFFDSRKGTNAISITLEEREESFENALQLYLNLNESFFVLFFSSPSLVKKMFLREINSQMIKWTNTGESWAWKKENRVQSVITFHIVAFDKTRIITRPITQTIGDSANNWKGARGEVVNSNVHVSLCRVFFDDFSPHLWGNELADWRCRADLYL